MRGSTPFWKNAKKDLLRATSAAAMCAALLAGCDSVDGQGGPEDPPPTEVEECGGFGVVCHVSGVAGEAGLGGNDGPAVDAKHYWPMDVTVGPGGELFIVDWNNHVVRRIEANGTMRPFIGGGGLGDDSVGPAGELSLNHPTELTIGDDGHYYLSSWHNWKIKRIDKDSHDTVPFVGTTQGLEGDGGPKEAAKMDIPSSMKFDFDGNMYIADEGNQRIRLVTPDGTITTFVGSERGFADGIGEEARFDLPQGPSATPGGKIAMNQDRTVIYMADTFNNRIRRIDIATREVTTIAGTGEAGHTGDGGPALAATLNGPSDVYLTHDNELFIADAENHSVRKIDANGVITTVVGNGQQGIPEDGVEATSTSFNKIFGVAYDEAAHTLYFTDTFNHMVKKVYLGHEN